ncbi:MAG: hypothetical protein QOH83_2248 [Solirubrobacteraceae bacterium]|nr:hypothetical protein [Solirubrobacteraceae bacterium]
MSQAVQRLREAYVALDRNQRFAAGAAIGLLLAMFLPWYEKTVVITGTKSFASDSISAFGAVSFVEAAIFLVAAGVLALLLARADRRAFHLPGGDGTVIFAAGLWATALIFYRVFDRPDVSGEGGTVGIQWGFFVAFVAAGALAVAGQRIRASNRPEPRLPAADPGPRRGPDEPTAATKVTPRAARASADARATEAGARRGPSSRAVTREDARQLTFDDPADEPPLQPGEIPRARDRS